MAGIYDHYSNIGSGTNGYAGPNDQLARTWLTRIEQSEEQYKAWKQRFLCDKMELYYEGQQWEPSGTNYTPYTINLVFSSIEIKLPSILFETPQFHVKPKPQGEEYDFEESAKKALLRQDILNTQVMENIPDFCDQIELAILDAFFRFGLIEVGYSADWIENPNADKPILKSDEEPYYSTSTGNVIKQPKKLPADERIYVRRIPGANFRCGGISKGIDLAQLDWCAYWDWMRVEDIKANPNLKNVEFLSWSGGRSPDYVKNEWGPEVDQLVRSGDLMKVWTVFDNRKKRKYMFCDSQTCTIFDEKFNLFPLHALRFHKLTRGWYPMPPASNWKSPQDEYNEAREQSRNHRKRFTRKFLYKRSGITVEEEIDKLINGGDGTFIASDQSNLKDIVVPIENADLGPSSNIGMTVTKEDFNLISGTTSEQHLQTDRTTATQATLANSQAQVRDSRARIQVARWMQDIGKSILLTIEDKFTLPMWVRMEVSEPTGQDIADIREVWAKVTAEDLKSRDGHDLGFSVSISLDSMSPIESQQAQQGFITFLSIIQNYPEIGTDPLLVREAAYKCGYRNEQAIARMQKIAQLVLIQKMAQLQGAAGQAAAASTIQSQMGQQTLAQAQGSGMEQINNATQNPATAGGGIG